MKRTLAGIAFVMAGLAAVLAVLAPAGAIPAARASGPAGTRAHPVIVIGISGLRWDDISAAATPAIWRLAQAGSVGSLATATIHPVTCPADAWLTLNAGARAAQYPARPGCGPMPAVLAVPRQAASWPGQARPGPARPAPARIPAMRAVIARNAPTGYEPDWGVLARAAGPGQCATAIGPGGALALANTAGQVARYLPAPAARHFEVRNSALRQCPLTVIDLGVLAPAGRARTPALARADRAVARIAAAAPAGSILLLAGLGDGADSRPQLRAIVVSGPGYRAGLLTSASTRQPGIVTITDLTTSIFGWRGAALPGPPAGAVRPGGARLTTLHRASLQAAIRTMAGQDTANQVYRSIVGWFFLYYGIAEAAVFAAIALALRGDEPGRVRRRVAWYTAAAAVGGAVPAGTFLAGLVPWGQLAHPALWLYGLGLAWAAVIAVPAVTGPWRRDPFGPPGFVAAVTLAVVGIDVMTGSALQLGAPFGLSLVEAGRFYGIGNNALGVYLTAGILTAAWAASAAARRGGPDARRRATAAAGAVALASVVVSGWPGFGAKVGGTVAMVPAFLVLLATVAGVRITPRRGLVVALSGLALVAAFAIANYLGLAGSSHLANFVGQLLHGGAGGTLHRKITSNLRSVTLTWYTLVPPVVAAVSGAMLAWPDRLRLRTFAAAAQRSRLLRTTLAAVWLAAVLSWFLEDSGVSVVAAALPIALPLGITLVIRVASLPAAPQEQRQDPDGLICAVPGNSGCNREDWVKYQLSRLIIGPALHLLARTDVTGAENVPESGAAILASNHLSVLDSFYLPLMLERPVTFAAKSEYFTGTKPVERIAGAYLRATKQLSVDRAGARAAQEMLEAALALLKDGALFGIYPEGTRSPDGRLYRGRTGVGWLALHSGAPVIPVAMVGTDRLLPPGRKIPRPGRIEIRIGKPLLFEEYRDQPAGARQRRAVTDQVVEAIRELSGQEFAPMYASVRKEQLAAARNTAAS